MSGQHASLTVERWAQFSYDQQILMIGNEMNRAAKLLAAADLERLRASYERVLALVDLTVQVQDRPSRCRELLRWRDLGASLYISEKADPEEHAEAFRCLLQFTPASYDQLPFVLPLPARGAEPPA